MIRVPQLRGYKNILTRNGSSGDFSLQRLPYLMLIQIPFRAIKMSKPNP
jgi:hypothetical protein